MGPGNVELAAKYRFLTQDNFGLDVAVFPRVFLPSARRMSATSTHLICFRSGCKKTGGQWSAFGGGGCEINRGGDSQKFCLMGAVVTRQIIPNLQVGLEMFHQTADPRRASDDVHRRRE